MRSALAVVMDRLEQPGDQEYVGVPVVMTLHERRHGDTRWPLLLL